MDLRVEALRNFCGEKGKKREPQELVCCQSTALPRSALIYSRGEPLDGVVEARCLCQKACCNNLLSFESSLMEKTTSWRRVNYKSSATEAAPGCNFGLALIRAAAACRWPDLSCWGPGDETGRPPRCLCWGFALSPSPVSWVFGSGAQRGGEQAEQFGLRGGL